MVRNMVMVLVCVLGLMWATGASAQMKEGLWEITTKGEVKGMSMQMPATTAKQCVTRKDMVPKPEKQDKNQECTMKDQKVTGDAVTYVMECKGKDGMVVEVSGKMTYKGDALDGTSTTVMKSKGQGTMQIISKVSGKYLGPCPK
jgi:hypothetical protein